MPIFQSRRVTPSSNVRVRLISRLILDRETVQLPSSQIALAKSANKHNRIYMTAEPLGDDLVNDIESGKFDTRQEFKTRGRLLADNYGWDVNQARKIFAFGPTDRDPNVIVDATVGIDTREIRDSVVTAFTQYGLSLFCANVLEPQLRDLLQVNNYVGYVFKSLTSNSTPMPSIADWDNFMVNHPQVSQAKLRSC